MIHKAIRSGLLIPAVFVALALAVYAPCSFGQSQQNVTFTVTAVAKKKATLAPIKRDDVQMYKGRERLQISGWQPGETLYLAVLIDDSLDDTIANQWSDLKAFFAAQPKTTYIAVFYARNGAAMLAQDFTNDHQLAAKALRLPLGYGGAFTSPYLTLQDLAKRWPANSSRNSILMFSSGIDYFRGMYDPVDVDLDTTIEDAQKKNINIWTIYAPDAGHRGQGFFLASRAQDYLSQLSDETGAESFYLGVGTPVTFKPYFGEIALHLSNQYLLTFSGESSKKPRFERVRVVTELPNIEFLTPSAVYLQGDK